MRGTSTLSTSFLKVALTLSGFCGSPSAATCSSPQMATRRGVRLFLYRAVELVGLLAVIVVLVFVGVPVWIPLLVIVAWIAAPRFVRWLRRTWNEAGRD